MVELLLYATIQCQDAADMISRVKATETVDELIKTEIIATVKEATPHCTWDAND